MRDERGFTLVEAIVAMAIVALVLPLAVQAVTDSTRRADRTVTERKAVILAQSIMAQLGTTIPLDLAHPPEGVSAGLRWGVTIERPPDAAGSAADPGRPRLLDVSVAVTKDGRAILTLAGVRATTLPSE
ncbi:type II secretion system GspH family protein [Inquilinus limosus]|uniref:prepilin-type N-terminal cleavage/methylation domain-containing protein n=1 Tax=Inquilinus limosus TaxID=171674 RepID=UPI003F174EAC